MPLHAGEAMFGRLYTTDTVPLGRFELKQSFRYRTERSQGRYSAVDGRTEFEYGLDNDYQLSVNLNSGHIDAENAPDDHPAAGATTLTKSDSYIQGGSLEFLYRMVSPIKSPVGVALDIQLGIDSVNPKNGLDIKNAVGQEVRLIFQTNLNDDQVVFAFNTSYRRGSIQYPGEEVETTANSWSNELGGIFRFASNWFAGLEARIQNDWTTKNIGGSSSHATYWAGPVLHYGGRRGWLTLNVLRQVYGTPGDSEDLFLQSNEKWESNFKVGFPF